MVCQFIAMVLTGALANPHHHEDLSTTRKTLCQTFSDELTCWFKIANGI